MKAYAPGKLILSGEHAVVYGKPALAMAVNRYAVTTITQQTRPHISFDLADIAHHSRLSFYALRRIKDRIKRKYHRFIRGDFSIRDVLQQPFELAHFALSMLTESLNLSLPHGVNIQLQSDIPIGCGMGSSAATIISVMHAISHYLHIPLAEETLFRLALETENMQHGRSSGLDLRVALQGGCLYVENGHIASRPLPNFSMHLVNTGTPLTSTGQCVSAVAPHFISGNCGDTFANVTKKMDNALTAASFTQLQTAVNENHALLVQIGVVPLKVQQFIAAVEVSGGAAKICGAGAISGDAAGVVLVLVEETTSLTALCARFGYHLLTINGVTRGVYVD